MPNNEEGGYETVPEPPNNDHEGYERVEDYWRGEDGYELVRGHSKRSRGGFERLTFSSSSAPKKNPADPGYETLRDPPPLPRHHPGYIDPPYARLEKDEEESEEGYETIPASEQHRGNSRKNTADPGYESVSNADKPEPGYETVPPKPEPGYETVKPEPGYEIVPGKKSSSGGHQSQSTIIDHGYETVPALRDSSSLSNSLNVVHLSVRKTHSDPPPRPQLRPRSAAASVVVIEPNKMAVNNNLETKKNTNSSGNSAADDVQAHIFV